MNLLLEDSVVLKILSDAGWYPCRKVDITDVVLRIEQCGFLVHSLARLVLETLHGLSGRGPDFIVDPFEGMKLPKRINGPLIRFDPEDYLVPEDGVEGPHMPSLLGEQGCPVAMTSECLLFLGVSGRCMWISIDWITFTPCPSLDVALSQMWYRTLNPQYISEDKFSPVPSPGN